MTHLADKLHIDKQKIDRGIGRAALPYCRRPRVLCTRRSGL
jgi:hypothetical protein